MGFWSRLFGANELPTRTRGPERALDGELRDGKKHGLWVEPEEFDWQLLEARYVDGVREGPFRIWHRDSGLLRASGVMVAGQHHGTIVSWHQGSVRARHETVAGKMHGLFQAFNADGSVEYERTYRDGSIWSGRDDIDLNGVSIQRGEWRDGKRVGAFERNDGLGEPTLRANYVDGQLDGAYRTFHSGGLVKLEGTYANGKRIGAWRWHDARGTVLAESDDGANWRVNGFVVPAGDADPEKWITLALAWANLGHWFAIEHAVDAFDDVKPAVEWLRARINERPETCRSTYGGWLEHVFTEDPRGELINGIVVDHRAFNADQIARLVRRAPQFRELSLSECDLEPGVDALFPPEVVWPNLEKLSVEECGPHAEFDARRFPKLQR